MTQDDRARDMLDGFRTCSTTRALSASPRRSQVSGPDGPVSSWASWWHILHPTMAAIASPSSAFCWLSYCHPCPPKTLVTSNARCILPVCPWLIFSQWNRGQMDPSLLLLACTCWRYKDLYFSFPRDTTPSHVYRLQRTTAQWTQTAYQPVGTAGMVSIQVYLIDERRVRVLYPLCVPTSGLFFVFHRACSNYPYWLKAGPPITVQSLHYHGWSHPM